jgi:hypothetical protein
MRLLNSKTISIHEFTNDTTVPRYAILSHTWGDDEVTYEDMVLDRATVKKGYEKIRLCCGQAARHGLKWAWVDT